MPCINYDIPYASEEAVEFADQRWRLLAITLLKLLSNLAEERGVINLMKALFGAKDFAY